MRRKKSRKRVIKDTWLIGSIQCSINQMIIKVNFYLPQVQLRLMLKQFRLKTWTGRPNWSTKNQWLCKGSSKSFMNRIRVVFQNFNRESLRSFASQTAQSRRAKKNQSSTDHTPMERFAHDLSQSNSYSLNNFSIRMLHRSDVAR